MAIVPANTIDNTKILIGLMSIFASTCVSYWFSDFFIDFHIVSGIYMKILLTLIGFLLIPFGFWLFENEFSKTVSKGGKNTKMMIIFVGIFVVITLAQLITGKLK